MADAAPATTETTTAPPPAATTAAPWHQGKVDAEVLGAWQNAGWKTDDPVDIAVNASKSWREAQKYIGVPADQLLRLPKDAKDEAGWNAVWSRLGKPKEAKDYDLSGVKFANGTALDDAFVDMIRQTAYGNHVPRDAATAFANAIVKFTEQKDAAELAEVQTKIEAEKATLAKNWGPNMDLNRLTAMQGAKRLGVTPEDVQLLESQLGFSRVMEMFRKIGAGTGEDTFVESPTRAGNVATYEQAVARRAELLRDTAWSKRWNEGGIAEQNEMLRLNTIIATAEQGYVHNAA